MSTYSCMRLNSLAPHSGWRARGPEPQSQSKVVGTCSPCSKVVEGKGPVRDSQRDLVPRASRSTQADTHPPGECTLLSLL